MNNERRIQFNKFHQTVEGTRLQLISDIGRTSAVIVSTLMEAWGVVQGGLVADGTVKDVSSEACELFRFSPILQLLYGLPVGLNKLDDLSILHAEMSKYGGTVRILLDNLDQVKFLEEYERAQKHPKKWSAFIKINSGAMYVL